MILPLKKYKKRGVKMSGKDLNDRMKQHKIDKAFDKEKNIILFMPLAAIGMAILFGYNWIINNDEPEYKEYKSTIENIGKPPVKSFKYTIEMFNNDEQLACKTYDEFGYPVIVGEEKDKVKIFRGSHITVWEGSKSVIDVNDINNYRAHDYQNVHKAYLIQKSKGWKMEVKEDDVIFINDELDLEITAFKYTDYKYVTNQYDTEKCDKYWNNYRVNEKVLFHNVHDKTIYYLYHTAPMYSIINK